MKALTFNPSADLFSITELPVPDVSGTDVLIQVEACGLNLIDAKIRQWKHLAPSMSQAWVPGLDVSGRIVAIGGDVTLFSVGDRVLCHGDMFRPHGGLQNSRYRKMPRLSHTQTRPERLRRRRHALGGQLGERLTTNSMSLNTNRSSLPAVPAGLGDLPFRLHPISTLKKLSLAAQPQITPLGLDTVGGENDITVANALCYEGAMVELVETVRPKNYQDAFMKGLSFHQLSLGSGHRNGAKAQAILTNAGRAFSSLLEQGVITVPKITTIALEEAGAALNAMLQQRTVGKIVCML
jgi:NADPH:quinone reductase-like Zn-dependent oxidoreductase